MKCQICKENEKEWSWQPDLKSFYLPGNHIRGSIAIAVCNACREKIKAGDEVRYTYKGQEYIANEKPQPLFHPADIHANLWDGGQGIWEPDGSCTMICRDIEADDTNGLGHDVVALVVDPEVAKLFLTAPQLLTCSEALREVLDLLPGETWKRAMKALADLDFARLMN